VFRFFGTPQGTDVRDAWERRRTDLLPRFVAQYPGHRPHGWWLVDSPEQRRSFADTNYAIQYEPETEFLRRLMLLTTAEIEALSKT
jgi:hypothetical protein